MKKFICTKCNIEKEASFFSPEKRKSSGLCSICKQCRNIFIKDKRDRLRGKPAQIQIKHKRFFESNGGLLCVGCKIIKDTDSFHSSSSSSTGKAHRCKCCVKEYSAGVYLRNKDIIKAKSKDYYAKNTDKFKKRARRAAMKKNYGLTIEQADSLIREANNRCEICSTHQSELNKRLSIDHNHITGKVRGVLCYSCNHAIGRLKSDEGIALLEKAIEYIKKQGASE